METELIVEGAGFPPLSARGCSQEITLVEQGNFRRTINGELAYFGPQAPKYRSVIYCEDKTTLVNEGVLVRGAVVRVGCLQRLWQKANTDRVELKRQAVSGSVVAVDATQRQVPINVVADQMVQLAEESVDDANGPCDVFISYRPWLVMRVLSLKLSTDEWGLKAGWRLELEEV